MPTYNRAYCINRAIDSILKQSYCNWELIIVDDNSSDSTFEIVDKHKSQDSRIRYISLKKNLGASNARNKGMEIADGDFITFLDTDDEYVTSKIEDQVHLFLTSKKRNLGVVSCGAIDFKNGKEYNRRMPIRRINYYKSLLAKQKRIGAGTPFLMIKSQVVKETGISFDPVIPAMEDWDFLLQICEKYEFDFVNDYLVYVHHHENERLYSSSTAINAIDKTYNKHLSKLQKEPWAHKKFLKHSGALMAHHNSVEEAIKFIKSKIPDLLHRKDRMEIKNFYLLLHFFHLKYLKLFYLKYLNR